MKTVTYNPETHALVPREPTDEMLKHFAGVPIGHLHPSKQAAEFSAYKTMIAAAPQPEPVESELFGTVLVNRESGEVVMFYSPDMVPDISAIKDCFELVDLFATPQPEPVDVGPVAWIAGTPPHPYDKEWFIAKLDNGQKVVLKALPEEYSYDFRTADDTYYKSYRVKQWMQFPDSEFVPFTHPPADDELRRVAELEDQIAVLQEQIDLQIPAGVMVAQMKRIAELEAALKVARDAINRTQRVFDALRNGQNVWTEGMLESSEITNSEAITKINEVRKL